VSLTRFLAAMLVVCAIVLVDVLFMLQLGVVAAPTAQLLVAPDRVAAMLARFPDPGANATVLAACNGTVPTGNAAFLGCALQAYTCVVGLRTDLALANASSSTTALPPSVDPAAPAATALWAWATWAVPGTCLYAAPLSWPFYVSRLVWLQSTLLAVVITTGVCALVALVLRWAARDVGFRFRLAVASLLRPIVVTLPLAVQYMAIVAVAAAQCWACLATPACPGPCGGGGSASAEAGVQLLVTLFSVGVALRCALLAGLMARAFWESERRPVTSAVALTLTTPLWLPLLLCAVTVVVCVEPSGFLFRQTGVPPSEAIARVAVVGLPIACTAALVGALFSVVFYWRLGVRSRVPATVTTVHVQDEEVTSETTMIALDDLHVRGSVTSQPSAQAALAWPRPWANSPATGAEASPRPSIDSGSSAPPSPTKLLRSPQRPGRIATSSSAVVAAGPAVAFGGGANPNAAGGRSSSDPPPGPATRQHASPRGPGIQGAAPRSRTADVAVDRVGSNGTTTPAPTAGGTASPSRNPLLGGASSSPASTTSATPRSMSSEQSGPPARVQRRLFFG
jgi:hypothetical protein